MRLAALLLWASVCSAQMTVSFPGPGPFQANSTPNMVLIEAVAGKNTTSGTYTCTFVTSTTTGEAILVQEADYAASPAAPSVPTASGATFVTDASLVQTSNGRLTFFNAPNVSSGITSITLTPASGASSGVCSHWTGAATSSLLNVVSSNLHANSSSQPFFSDAVTGTQAVTCIGGVYNRTNGTDSFSAGDVWTTLKASPNTSDGDQLFTEYIVNGTKGQYVMNGQDVTAARNQWAGTACYKPSAAGSFTGQTPTTFLSMTGTNGNAVTLANLPFNPNLGVLSFANGTSCFTYNNANGLAALTTNATNGTQYTGSGTNAVAYALSCNGASDNQITFPLTVGLVGNVTSVGVEIKYPNTAAIDNFTMGGLVSTGTNTDRCYPLIESPDGINYDVRMENALSDSASTINVTSLITGGTPLWITYKMDKSGTPTCTMAVYNASTGAQVGSNITNVFQAASTPSGWSMGRFDSGVSTGTAYYIRAIIDYSGTFPLLL